MEKYAMHETLTRATGLLTTRALIPAGMLLIGSDPTTGQNTVDWIQVISSAWDQLIAFIQTVSGLAQTVHGLVSGSPLVAFLTGLMRQGLAAWLF